MSLKDLTKDNHTKAEKQEFVKILFSGKIDPKFYAQYLKNQHPVYEILEVCAMPHGLFNGIGELRRAPAILEDFLELWGDTEEQPTLLPVVNEYIQYILSIKDDPKKLMAHVYVRHMGDLSGGQMISRFTPGQGKFYQFENVNALKTAIRERIDDSMADEANVCFEFAIRMFEQMMTLKDE